MEYFVIISVVFTVISFNPALATLRCLECFHVMADKNIVFAGSDSLYRLVDPKNNPACGFENPNDRIAYNEWLSHQRVLQQQMPIQQQQFYNPEPDISETICPVIGLGTNKCRLLKGEALAFLPTYNAKIKVEVALRDCNNPGGAVEDVCYIRNSALGYTGILTSLRDKLSFMSPDIKMESFYGSECFCSGDRCTPIINGSEHLHPSIMLFVAALLGYLLLKRVC